MEANDFIKMEVVDSTGQNIGKVEDVNINASTGLAEDIIIKLDDGIFSKSKEKIKFNSVNSVKDVILLNIEIKK
jgi:sporulation protein YlmC with PRC-barrel domain